MGRRAYLNRLALGRSPYEAPDSVPVDPSVTVRRVSSVHADNYVQQYDQRGHPVNPESKVLGRELRKAKNDILSTMGIVVSGEDRKSHIPKKQKKKMKQIAAENDFGLFMATFDQLFVFFGTWWTNSLTSRVQTFKHYTHAALLDVIRYERGSTGILGFYFAGIPAWAVSTGLAIVRDSSLKRAFACIRDYFLSLTGDRLGVRSFFGLAYSAARTSIGILSVQAYMYSLLQSLALVPPHSIPSVRLFIPFGEESLIQMPPLATDLSLRSMGGSLTSLLTSPGVLTFLYAYYLRPEIEERLYRLIRRRLPKPPLADELSVRVAFEENLVEWLAPTLGRRSEEEIRRGRLSLLEDIGCELTGFRNWLFSPFGLRSRRASDPQAIEPATERIETVRNSIESLQHELEEMPTREDEPDDLLARSLEYAPHGHVVDFGSPDTAQSRVNEADIPMSMNRVLTNEENRISQSPGEMSSENISELATLGLSSAFSTASNQDQPRNTDAQHGSTAMDRQHSRSNTLFSRPSSPETSPPTSPRVRASLIHQSSDIITMQLELLGNRNRNPQNRVSNQDLVSVRPSNDGSSRPQDAAIDGRSLVEFLDGLMSNQHPTAARPHRTVVHQSLPADNESLSHAIAEESQPAGHDPPAANLQTQNLVQDAQAADHPSLDSITEAPTSTIRNILPDSVVEPNEEDTQSQAVPGTEQNAETVSDSLIPAPSTIPPMHRPNPSSTPHRVTLLSTHPVDSLASHLAAMISTLILSPLESVYLRSLAHSFLSSRPSSLAQLTDLHPVGLFGGGSWSDVAAYTGRLVLMRGMQIALRAGVWGLLVGSTMRIGRNFCGWGKL